MTWQEKLKKEWKTFSLAVSVTAVGAWEFAVSMGANIQDMAQYIPEKYRSSVLFGIGIAFLILRKYSADVKEEE